MKFTLHIVGPGRDLKKEVNASSICFELPPRNDLRKKLLDFQGQMYQKLDEPCAQTFTLPASARLLSVVMRCSHATRLKDVDEDGKEDFAATCNTLAARLHFRMWSAALKLLLSHPFEVTEARMVRAQARAVAAEQRKAEREKDSK